MNKNDILFIYSEVIFFYTLNHRSTFLLIETEQRSGQITFHF